MSIMDNLLDFLSSEPRYEERYSFAEGTNTCIRCGKQAREFRDKYGRLEYSCSALCQNCQDEFGLVLSALTGKDSQLNLKEEGEEADIETIENLEKA